MKRKLFLITDFFPYGTSETFVMTELRHLSRWYDVTVIPRYNGEGEPRPLPEGVKLQTVSRHMTLGEKLRFVLAYLVTPQGRREWLSILRQGKNCVSKLKVSLLFYAASELLWTELKENGIVAQSEGAVYYSFWHTASALALSAHRGELPGGRVVVRTHGYDLYNERFPYGRQPFKPAADAGIDRVVSCCRNGKEYYEKTFCVDDQTKYVVIPLGTDRQSAPGSCPPAESLRLVSCSMAVPLKRIDRIIQALAVLPDVPVEWTHVGDGDQLENLRAMAEEKLNGMENIRWQFTGNLDNARVHELYEAGSWDVFITTSSTEGSPISIQEAMSYGLPVIATAVGGIPELLEDSGNLLLSPEATPEETADAIRRIWHMSAEERGELHNANQLRWETNYCAGNNARRMMEMMEELWQS